MTIASSRPRDKNPDLVGLSAYIHTDLVTSEKSIVVTSQGGPCGVPEEQWLRVHALGSRVTGVYTFNGDTLVGRDRVEIAMTEHVEENYAHLLR